MRDSIGRAVLAALGSVCVVAGALGLAGIIGAGPRTATILAALPAIVFGGLLVRLAITGGRRAA